MSELLLFNKPFQVLTQFTSDGDKETLAGYIQRPGFYAAGRLDYDSEGLLILTDEGPVQHHLASPKTKLEKTYWVQVEGALTEEALQQLRSGVELKDGLTRPAKARQIQPPELWPRNPPIRERKNIPTSWIELKITEGKNRQVRRMTAAVGFPTLRLVRYAIGEWTLQGIMPGESRLVEADFKLKPKPQRSEQKRRRSPRINQRGGSKNRKR